jgi:hypothetical protein
MLTIATLKTLMTQHADDALVLVAIVHDGDGHVYEVVDWDTNGAHLQLHVAPERRYTWGPA